MKALVVFFVGIVAILAQEEDVFVRLPELGTIRGRKLLTKGNLGLPQKPFYNFRNIPFAESVSGERRFSQPVQLRSQIGTDQDPYDATLSGPLCPQLRLTAETVDTLNNSIMDDIIHAALEKFGLDNLISTNAVLKLLEDLMEVPLKNATVAQVVKDLVDVELSVSEDCLHLAVSTPFLPNNGTKQSELLPVMFFIYGGGFFAGTQLRMDYYRLGDVNDVVLVAISYRLGPLGFMCLDTDEAAGNMGLLDQIVGLEWVRDNIEYFGGDPNQVTIFGESAGSASVSHLVLSPVATGLFHKAIGESGSALAPWAFAVDNHEKHARGIAARVNCTQENLDELVACLKKASPYDIITADSDYNDAQTSIGAGLGFDGHNPCPQTKGARRVIEAGTTPEQILESGNYNHIPVMFGANLDEGLLPFSIADTTVLSDQQKNDSEFMSNGVFPFLFNACGITVDNQTIQLLKDTFFTPDQIGNYDAMVPGMVDMLGALFLKDPSLVMVEKNSRYSDSFFYSFEVRGRKSFHRIFDQLTHPNVTEPPLLEIFAAHADELLYIFDVPIPLVLCDPRELLTALVNAYLECIITDGILHAEQCVTKPDSNFRLEWGECIDSHLLPAEEFASDSMVRAWTNFAIYGDPTHNLNELPDLPPWSEDNQAYIAFDTLGTEVRTNYRSTYKSTPQKLIKSSYFKKKN